MQGEGGKETLTSPCHELIPDPVLIAGQQSFVAEDWQGTIAATFGLESTLRRRGRPRNLPKNEPVPFSSLWANSHAQEGRGNGSGILAWACVLAGEQNFQLIL